MGRPLNEFTGRSTDSLRRELARLNDLWDTMTDEDSHGGSPREWMDEQMSSLSAEIATRDACEEDVANQN